jgi:hypothetical protein
MGRAARFCAAILSLLVAATAATAGCGSDLITLGPTPVDQGIVIYIHADFSGSSQGIVADVQDLTKTEGPCSRGEEGEKPTWRECVSSVRVFPGWSAILYRDDDFKGRSVTLKYSLTNPTAGNTPYRLLVNAVDCIAQADGSLADCSNAQFGNLKAYLAYQNMVGQSPVVTEFSAYSNGGSAAFACLYEGPPTANGRT